MGHDRGPEADAVRAAWVSGLVEQSLGTFRVVGPELLELLGPGIEGIVIADPLRPDGPHRLPLSETGEVTVPDGLQVDRHLQRVAHPDVAEGRLMIFEAQRRLGSERDLEELHARVGFLEVQHAADRLDPRHTIVPGEIDLTGPERRNPGLLVAHHQHHEPVDVGQAVPRVLLVVLPVVGVPVKRDRGAADELVHEEGPGADHVVGVVDHVEGLGWVCPDVAVVEQLPMCVRVRPRQLDHERQLVGGRYRLDRDLAGSPAVPPHGLLAGKPADAEQALVVCGHIVGGQLAPGYRRLVVEGDVVADLEDVGQRIRVIPALGQVPSNDAQGEIGRELAKAAVECPVRYAQLVQRRSRDQPGTMIEKGVAVIDRVFEEYSREGPAVLRLEHSFTGGGIGHVLLLGSTAAGPAMKAATIRMRASRVALKVELLF